MKIINNLMKYLTKKTFNIYKKATLPYKWYALTIIISIIAASIFQMVAPLLYKEFFNILDIGGDSVMVKANLITILLKVLGVAGASWIFWRIAEITNAHLQTIVLRDLSRKCFDIVHKQSVTFFNNNFIGALVKKVSKFVWSYEAIFDSLTWDFLPALVVVSTVLFVFGQKNIFLMLIVLVWMILFILANYLFTKFKLKYDIKRTALDSKVSGLSADTFTNHDAVKLFTGIEKEKKIFADITQKWHEITRFCWNLAQINHAFQGFFMILLEVGTMYYAIILWERGGFTLGDFVLIQSYVLMIFRNVWSFGRIIRKFYEKLADAEEMTEIFEMPIDIKDSKTAKELKVEKGEIEFRNVVFNYNKTRKIFRELNIVFKPGRSIALIGPSGAGKSTIVKLLLRRYDTTKGDILIDGQKIKKVTQTSLWNQMSFVPQDPILFHRSLIENIRYGRFDATDEEVFEAAKAAHCHEFIEKLPEKYETLVGERGVKLSGGERQRVAIARAILRDAPILILDEATSSLDSESERLIQEALEKLMKGKTVIVIAHRLSTIMKMDSIVVIEEGMIKEHGTHKQLLRKKDGLYRKLWELQAGGFIA
jgi:ATP-binding cassette, subfamily B, bacterial